VKRDLRGFLDVPGNGDAQSRKFEETEIDQTLANTQPHIDRPALFESISDAPYIIDNGWEPDHIKLGRDNRGSVGLALMGVAIIFIGWLIVSLTVSVVAWYQVSLILGSLALGIYVVGALFIAFGCLVELRSLRSLRHVDLIRGQMRDSTGNFEEFKKNVLGWLTPLSSRMPLVAPVIAAVQRADTNQEISLLIQNRLAGHLRDEAVRIGLSAASRGTMLVALSPHAAWDGVIVGL
jgi:uncharacterized membrane protein YcjF (UPF0283 family)